MSVILLALVITVVLAPAGQAQGPQARRGGLVPDWEIGPAAKTAHDGVDHIDLDGQDLNGIVLTDEAWSRVGNDYTRIYGRSDWPLELPADGPSAEVFAESFFGIWEVEAPGFSPAPLSSISDFRRSLYLRQDLRAALRLQATERNPDGSPSDRVLVDQLQIARIYLKFRPEPVAGALQGTAVDGMYHIDYLEDYDCPCEFATEPCEVTRATRVFDTPPFSRTYYFRAFVDNMDRLIVSDVLKTDVPRTAYKHIGSRDDLATAVMPSTWGALKRIFAAARR
ncbi:MAG: hypothetical protein O2782_09250 [bacterium]|nr:hypothetical protein [bacterium]